MFRGAKKYGCVNTIYHATAALSFQIEICNLDRTKSSFLFTSLYKNVIFTKNWVTRSCRPSDDELDQCLAIMSKLKTVHANIIWRWPKCYFTELIHGYVVLEVVGENRSWTKLPYFGKRKQVTKVTFLVKEQNVFVISTDVNGISWCLTKHIA